MSEEQVADLPKVKSVQEILSTDEKVELKFGLLIGLIQVSQVSNKDVVDTVLHLLVGGEFDIENNFIIQEPENITRMTELLKNCSPTLQAEIWSVFTAILKKSRRNLNACTDVGLIESVLDMLRDANDVVADLLIDMLATLARYSITVKELKKLFSLLKVKDGKWPLHSVKLLSVLRQMPQRHGPDEFFSFPGKKGSHIALPPIKTWPYQNGWTFSCWFRLDPVTGVNVEQERPYLYCFRTTKGVGYSAHFLGSTLVLTSMKVKGKGFQHCVKYEFQPRKWYMVTVVHVYNRWSKSELRCYVDGTMVSSTDMSWLVSTSDPFDKCFLGASSEGDADHMLCGQMSTVYLFSEALTPHQIGAIFSLGPGYKSQFRFENEATNALNDTQRRALYEGKLTSAIVFMYNPIACDSQLCLESSPKGNISYFVHSPHALMSQEVKAVVTHSIHSTLHSLGGVQILFPLFGQLDLPVDKGSSENVAIDYSICSNLMGLLSDLIESSATIQQQFLQNRGFLLISFLLEKASKDHVTPVVLEAFLKVTEYLVNLPTGGPLLKHLFDHILFNPALWIHTSVEVQTKLYCYLATEFIGDAQIYNNIRRVSAVLQAMHSLKFYYWVVNPKDRSGISPKGTDGPRPTQDEIIKLRSFMLLYVKQLILKGQGILEDELQSMLNYLTTVHEDANLIDVLHFLVTLMAEHPPSMVPSFDKKQGIKTVFKLLASPSEGIRVQALKLLGFFLMRSTHKRKQDSMTSHNLFSLIGERLMLNTAMITMPTYNVLFEILTERMSADVHKEKISEPESSYRIENSAILKVVATMIRQSKPYPEVFDVKRRFLSDLTILCNNNRDNRRTVLQMSVWQDWLFSMSYIYPRSQDEHKITEMVMTLFKILLHHAIKFEYGGWRVWIDTLAILHSKVSYEDFKLHMSKMYKQYERQRVDDIADPNERQQHPISTISGVSDAQIQRDAQIPKSTVKIENVTGDEQVKALQNGDIDSEEKLSEDSVGVSDENIPSEGVNDNKTTNDTTDEKSTVVAVLKDEEIKEGDMNGMDVKSESDTNNIETADVQTASETKLNDTSDSDKTRTKSINKEPPPPVNSTGGRSGSSQQGRQVFSPGPRAPPFRIPEFRWSYLHQKLLSDLLYSIESDIQVWKSHSTKTVIDFVNSNENHVYVINVTHMISQLGDNLITSCGGLLPLLAAATSPNGEIEILEPNQGLTIEQAVSVLQRIMNMTDILVFASSTNFAELEQEKNLPAGGILRQCLRLVCTAAVRNCLECRHRYRPHTPSEPSTPKSVLGAQQRNNSSAGRVDPIQELISGSHPSPGNIENLGGQGSPIKDAEKLLQDMDINRLRAVVYRDVEETKQAQFLALAIVYFSSVLMVSKYRDILEPPSPAVTSNVQPHLPTADSPVTPGEQAFKSWQQLRPPLPLIDSFTNTFEQANVTPQNSNKADDTDAKKKEDEDDSNKVVADAESILAHMAFSSNEAYTSESDERETGEGGEDETVTQTEITEAQNISSENDNIEITEVPNDLEDREVEGEADREVEGEASADTPTPPVSENDINDTTNKESITVVEDEDSQNKTGDNSSHEEVDTSQVELTEVIDSPEDQKLSDDEKVPDDDTENKSDVEVESNTENIPEADVDDESKKLEEENGEKQREKLPDQDEPTEEKKDVTDEPEEVKPQSESIGEKEPASVVENGHDEVQNMQDKDNVSDVNQVEKSVEQQNSEEINQENNIEDESTGDKENGPDEAKSVNTGPARTKPDNVSETSSGDGKNEDSSKGQIASISVSHNSVSQARSGASKPDKLDLSPTKIPAPLENLPIPSEGSSLTERLERALGSVSPLLREVFVDFAPFLSKTLIGSHGQELLIGGLVTLKQSTSVVELVMLLCSQEWQNSLQKHAGLAFIELVNEGRVLALATRDHIVRVANEAEFILNRMRAEDVQKHAEFESQCAQIAVDRKEEEKLCDHLITAAKRRDHSAAVKNRDKIVNILTNKHGAWGDNQKMLEEFWKLDIWEDDSRRRRRLIKNSLGSTHPEATLKAAIEHGANEDAISQAREAFHAHLAANKLSQQQSSDYTDEELLMEEREFEQEFSGPVALSRKCKLIAPGVSVTGLMSITKSELYFEMDEDDKENQKIDPKVLAYVDHLHGKWHFSEIRAIFSRRYLLQNVAVEIFMANRTAVFFVFPDHATVKKVINALPKVGVGVKYGLPQSRRMSLASGKQLFKLANMTQKWQRREISNFDYLMFLNTVAGRTYNDLNQYPVFPWVIVNYEAKELDLSQPNNYRDLSKPVGSLNPTRKDFFEERFNSWEHDTIPPFHYGTHYSTAAFTLNWLIRVEPYTTIFLNMQGGKFDHANRIFHSVDQAWKNCQRDTSDVKELIPEFFYLPELFCNNNRYNLGKQEDGQEVSDVEIPPWARNPEDFVRINRMALESEFVSCQMHHWIDLIFGYKQKGPEAIRAINVFYYLTYEGSVNLESMTDVVMKEAIENQIKNFGQTPTQLITEPHQPRSSVMHLAPMMFSNVQDDVCMIMKFLSNSPVTHVTANTHPAIPLPAVVTITSNHNFAVNKWNASYQQGTPASFSSEKSDGQQNLPLSMDNLLVMNTGLQRRTLGDNFDQRLKVTHSSFVTTADNRFIFACGFWDKSFRLFSADMAKIMQVICGHFDIVTCITRSECNLSQDCFVVTGSKDCTVMVWMFNARSQAIVGDNGSTENPTPKAVITGHESEVTCISVLAELGVVVSGSIDGPVLVHTLSGDLLRSLDPAEECGAPDIITMSREAFVVVKFGKGHICNFSVNGKLLRSVSHKDNVQAMILSRDGQYLMTGGDAGVVEVWRCHDLALLYAYPTCDSCIRSLALTHDHKFLLAGLATGCLLVFNIDFNKWHHEYQQRY